MASLGYTRDRVCRWRLLLSSTQKRAERVANSGTAKEPSHLGRVSALLMKRVIILGVFSIGLGVVPSASAHCGNINRPPLTINGIQAVANTNCPTAKRVAVQWRRKVKAQRCSFNSCRSRGFRCRPDGGVGVISVQISCKRGRERVRWIAGQNVSPETLRSAGKSSRRRYHLTRDEAKYLMRLALRQDLGAAGTRLKCNTRIRRNRIRCRKIAWSNRTDGYRGTGTVWTYYKSDYLVWRYSYRIKHTNYYCLNADVSPDYACRNLIVKRRGLWDEADRKRLSTCPEIPRSRGGTGSRYPTRS